MCYKFRDKYKKASAESASLLRPEYLKYVLMPINTFHQNQPVKSEQKEEWILQTEIFIENLPHKEKQLVENYIDSLISQLALEETFLYQHGFIDGIKILKYIDKL